MINMEQLIGYSLVIMGLKQQFNCRYCLNLKIQEKEK